MDDSINDISLPIGLPKNVEELAELIAIANRDRVPVAIAGNSTKLDWGGIVTGAKSIVSTQKLDRAIAHAVGDLTVTVEAGMKFANLQAILASSSEEEATKNANNAKIQNLITLFTSFSLLFSALYAIFNSQSTSRMKES